MRVLQKTVPYKSSDSFRLAFLGDFHIGSFSADEDLLERVILQMKRDNAMVFLMGDYADALLPDSDHKYDPRVIERKFFLPEEQYARVYELLLPIRDQIMVLLTGNHDETLAQRHYHDWVDELASKLGAEYGTTSSFYRLRFKHKGRKTGIRIFDIFLHHGYFAGRTKSGGIKRVQEMSDVFRADLYAMGHVHNKDFASDIILEVDKSYKIMQRHRYYLLTGSFFKSYQEGKASSYAEKRMYRPTDLGAMGIDLKVIDGHGTTYFEVSPVRYD